MKEDTEKKQWLVKSSGHVFGPLSYNDVKERLLTGEFSVIDEVCLPLKRWAFVRDVSLFFEIIVQVQKKMGEKSEDTDMLTSTLSLTQDLFDENTDSGLDEDFFDSNIPQKPTKPPPQSDHFDELRTFGSLKDVRVKRKINKSLLLTWLFIVLIVGMSFYILLEKENLFFSANVVRSQDLSKEGFQNFQQGNYKKALELLQEAHRIDSENPEIQLRLASLLIVLEGQTVKGGRLLERALGNNKTKETQRWANLVLGLAEMVDGRYRFADQYFDQVLNGDQNDYVSIVNKGIIAFQQGFFLKANNYFERAIKSSNDYPLTQLMRAQNLINWGIHNNEPTYLKQAQKILGFLDSEKSVLTLKALLLSLQVENLLNFEEGFFKKVNQFLKINPDLDNQFLTNILIYDKHVSWNELYDVCRDVFQSYKDNLYVKLVFAVCDIKSGHSSLARQKITEAKTMDPQNSTTLAIQAYYLNNIGREMEAKSLLKVAASSGQTLLPLKLEASWCVQRADWECAEQNWEKIFRVQSQSVEAVAGLAQVHFHKKNLSKTKEYLARALSLSKHYKPSVELHLKMAQDSNK